MEKESQTTDYLAALLGDIEAKKAALDALAAAVRAAIAAGALGAPSDLQLGSIGSAVVNTTVVPAGFADLPRGAFLGKTATEAIKLYLSAVRRKQTNKEIAQALRDGGLESAGDFGNFITSALFRLKKEGVVLRFDDGWGLSEWYNEAFRAKIGAPNNKKAHQRSKKKRKKKDAAQQSPAPPKVPTVATPEPLGIDNRLMQFLRVHAPDGFAAKDLAAAVGAQGGVVNFALVRLVKKGFVRRGEDGSYYAVKEP